jgi:hypothetical protein
MDQMTLFQPPVMERRTYGFLALSKNKKEWIISNAEAHVCIRLKQLFPRIPKTSEGPFEIIRDPATDADVKWFMERYPFQVSDRDRDILEQSCRDLIQNQAEMERLFLPDYKPPVFIGLKPGQEVRRYQGQAIELGDKSGGLLLADPCGSGKTYTGIAFALDTNKLPAAVVCQTHLQGQWVEKAAAFSHIRVCVIKTTRPHDLPEADIYIFRYSQLAGWTDVFAKKIFRTVIYDEPQDLRHGTKSDKGKSAAILSKHATWKLGLTATPIFGFGVEIFNVMSYINDTILGDEGDFLREWTTGGPKPLLKDPKALGTYLRDSYAFLRRTKAEIGRDMPPVNKIIEPVPYDEKAVHDIEALARQLAIKATTGSFIERGQAARDLDIMVRQATGVAKAQFVAAYVRIIVESGEPVILLGWHRAVYDIWLRELRDLHPVMFTGSESASQKAKALDDFKTGRTKLLIMSLRSAAGIDGLQFICNTMIFGELDWAPGVLHQAIERISREGQENPVTAIFLVADGGSDPPMIELLGLKSSEAQQVIDPLTGPEVTVSDRDKIRSLVARYLDKAHRDQIENVVTEMPSDMATA